MSLKLYRFLTYVSYPFVLVLLGFRLNKGKEHALRYKERYGICTRPRPAGRLIWLHGASVGECLSMMPLIDKLIKEKNTTVMVTSGTVTSAELMEKRLPKGAFHHFIPVDFPVFVKRFLNHFKPDLALFFESDFWPNMLMTAHKAKIPMILLNGRISDKSFKRWQSALFFIKPLLQLFTLTMGQTAEDARRLRSLGAPKVTSEGNLKFAATPLPVNEDELVAMRNAIGNRVVWVAGSTHDKEEEKIARVHKVLSKKYPNLLTISVPRHAIRGEEVQRAFESQGLTVHRRSTGQDVNADVYLGDTMGEMGLFYRLAPIVFVGGSLIPFGGQNMLEPMRAGACVFIGPHAFNFAEIVRNAKKIGGLVEVADEQDLIEQLSFMIEHHPARTKIAAAGQELAYSETAVLERVYSVLEPWVHG